LKFPLENPQKINLKNEKLSDLMQEFSNCFQCEKPNHEIGKQAQGFFGYTSYDAIPFFENIKFKEQSEKIKFL
jgi:anthranilate synthase component 1